MHIKKALRKNWDVRKILFDLKLLMDILVHVIYMSKYFHNFSKFRKLF